VKLRELPGSIGVEVEGLDLFGEASGAADADTLRQAFDERHLVLRPGEVLPGVAQVAFVARFGTLVPERRLWAYVSNVRPDGVVREGALLFHSDFAFTPWPVHAISLHALELPAGGTSTHFADAARAATLLPADLRRRLDGRRVLNLYDFHRPDDRPMRVAEADPRSPRTEHPVIGTHQRTGDAVVMASELHTDHVIGLPAAESDALLRDLFAVLYDESNVYVHEWSIGDLVLWDNLALQHGPQRRIESSPIVRNTRGRDQTPSGLHVHAAPEHTSFVSALASSSLI
jgi:taurine dioxygenase